MTAINNLEDAVTWFRNKYLLKRYTDMHSTIKVVGSSGLSIPGEITQIDFDLALIKCILLNSSVKGDKKPYEEIINKCIDKIRKIKGIPNRKVLEKNKKTEKF